MAPLLLSAQPVISGNEYYNTGNVIQMVNCYSSGIVAGATGAGVVWNFSTLTASGGYSTTTILHDTSTLFYTSNLMELMPDGTTDYVLENSSNTYINGVYDPGTGYTTYYDNYDISKRPFIFDTAYVDSYYINTPATNTYGTGVLTETGDSYGTLILPTGTFTNVLRIRKLQEEIDTTGTTYLYTISVSYLWFDNSHAAPLLRMDSVSNIARQTQDVMYLSMPAGIKNIANNQNNYSSYFDNSGGLVVNGFEPDQNYVVTLYNIIGNKMFTANVSTTRNSQRFDVTRTLDAGIYLVSIISKNTSSDYPTVIKVSKSY